VRERKDMPIKLTERKTKYLFETKNWRLDKHTTYKMDEDVMTGDISNKKLERWSLELKRVRRLSLIGTNKEDTIG
jgi:hypothetical protein